MEFHFSGLTGLLALLTFPCLTIILGKGLYLAVQGQWHLIRKGRDTVEGLQQFWGGLTLLLLSLFIATVILSTHSTNGLFAAIFLFGAALLFLSDIAVCVRWHQQIA